MRIYHVQALIAFSLSLAAHAQETGALNHQSQSSPGSYGGVGWTAQMSQDGTLYWAAEWVRSGPSVSIELAIASVPPDGEEPVFTNLFNIERHWYADSIGNSGFQSGNRTIETNFFIRATVRYGNSRTSFYEEANETWGPILLENIEAEPPGVAIPFDYNYFLTHSGFADWWLYQNDQLLQSGSIATGQPGQLPISGTAPNQGGTWILNVIDYGTDGNSYIPRTIPLGNTAVVGGSLQDGTFTDVFEIVNNNTVNLNNTVSTTGTQIVDAIDGVTTGVVTATNTLDSIDDNTSEATGLLTRIADSIDNWKNDFDEWLETGPFGYVQDLIEYVKTYEVPTLSFPDIDLPWIRTFTVFPNIGMIGQSPNYPPMFILDHEINMNQFVSQLAPPASFIRNLIVWITSALFLVYAFRRMQMVIASIYGMSPPATSIGPENVLVPGAAQAKMLMSGLPVAGGVFALYMLYASLVTQVCGVDAYWTDPTTGAPATVTNVLATFNMVIPLDVILCHIGGAVVLEATSIIASMVLGAGIRTVHA